MTRHLQHVGTRQRSVIRSRTHRSRSWPRAVNRASTPIYVAVLGEAHAPQADADLRQLIDRVHQDGTYIVVGGGGGFDGGGGGGGW